MKKYFTSITIFALILYLLAGCDNSVNNPTLSNENIVQTVTDPYTFDMASSPIIEDREFSVKGDDSVSFNLVIPQKGYFKALIFDNTEYKKYTDKETKFILSVIGSDGKVVYENIKINYGFDAKYVLEPGKYTAKVDFVNKIKNMSDIFVTFAFAPISDEPAELVFDKVTTAYVDDDNMSQFKLNVGTASLILFEFKEAGLYEGTCDFTVYDSSDNVVVKDLFISDNDFRSRRVFLPAGDYIVKVKGTCAVTQGYATVEQKYDDIALSGDEDLVIPAVLGFAHNTPDYYTIPFNVDVIKEIEINADGLGHYYDLEQSFGVIVKDSDGKTLYGNECEWFEIVKTNKFSGQCYLTVYGIDNGIASISLVE